MSTLWYHDHRVDFTAQNVYKGLAGFYLLFNQFDTGDETTGFRLPSFPNFDIPMMFNLMMVCWPSTSPTATAFWETSFLLTERYSLSSK
jgi:hypothetical protein